MDPLSAMNKRKKATKQACFWLCLILLFVEYSNPVPHLEDPATTEGRKGPHGKLGSGCKNPESISSLCEHLSAPGEGACGRGLLAALAGCHEAPPPQESMWCSRSPAQDGVGPLPDGAGPGEVQTAGNGKAAR